jgi:hypothetical protein
MFSTNILILSDNESEFNETRSVLKSIVGSNLFTIYQIRNKDLDITPWMKNCTLFIDFNINKNKPVGTILEYLQQGGKILSIPSNTLNKVEKNLMDNNVNIYDGDLKGFYENQENSVKYIDWSDSFLYSYPSSMRGLHCATMV